MARQLRRDEYTVGWVCALYVELTAAQEMLDEEHDTPPSSTRDTNIYTCGRVGKHNVVIACLPEGQKGTHSAATVAVQMRLTFTSMCFMLMVGIGGGVPSEEADIRLGDVVVGTPHATYGGVVQYDSGKATPNGFDRTGSLNAPPIGLLNAVAYLRAQHMGGKRRLDKYLSKLDSLTGFAREAAGPDVLYDATYDHKGGPTCKQCDTSYLVDRELRKQELVVHYGTIASGNQVIRSATERDRLSARLGGVLCFEMEAAGLMNSFPCLVIRGICDYADSHKNKRWQAYAAVAAAAYAKELLSVIPPAEVTKTNTVDEAMRKASIRATYYIPFVKNRYFIGRQNELRVLQQKLIVDQDCQKLSIVGLGGTGKTQVALQFAYSVKERWPECSVLWVPALSMESFEQACIGVARALRIPLAAGEEEDVKKVVQQHLSSSRAGRWLLVVDNADDPHVFFGTERSKGIVEYLPENETGAVVYTTRTPEIAEITRGDVVEIGAMDRQDAVVFLTRSLTRKDLLRDDATTTELLDELTYLPLAIAQAAAYLNRNRISVAKYLYQLRSTEQDIVALMSREFRDDTRYKESANAIASTWVVSFSQIREHNAEAAGLLAFMSCVEWKAIPRSLLPRVQAEWQMEEAIGTLCGYSFLARRDDGETEEGQEEWYDMHRLVHLATKIWITNRGDKAGVLDKAVRQVAGVFPSDDYANRMVWRAYLPHALRLLRSGQQCSIKEKPGLCLLVGRCLRVDGRIKEAVAWLEESCRLREALGEDDRDRLLSQHVLAMVYRADGQVWKAIELLQHVVAVREKVLEEEHPDRLTSQHELAIAYRADGQVRKATELLQYVVAVQEKMPAKEHPYRLASQHALAMAYRADGQVWKAIELLQYVVAVREKVLEEEHPDRLASQHELAIAYQADGQVQKSVELLRHVVAVQEKVLVEEHPDQLASQRALAMAYRVNGQVQKAIELLQYIVAVQEVLAEEHLSRLASQHELAIAYQADEQVHKAVELLQHVVAVREKVLVEEHPSRLASQHALAMAYRADGQVLKAVELLQHVVAVEARSLRNDHPSRLLSLKALAALHAKLDER